MLRELICISAFILIATYGAQRPNIVVFLTDDQGWGDLSLHGNSQLATPNIDQLARDGAQFEHFYVSPVCSPTRALRVLAVLPRSFSRY